MSTGLFPIRESNGGRRKGCIPAQRRNKSPRPHGYLERRQTEKMRRIEALAEAMAEGAPTVKAAAAALGIPQGPASRYWTEIRERLGDQAR